MSLLRKIELEGDDVFVTLELTKDEYKSITPNMKEFIILPTNGLERTFITGKLGNGNRIMVPNRFLRNHDIDILRKKVLGKMFRVGERKFLVLEIDNKEAGIPVFREDIEE
jgi:hypothetical protein